MPLHCTMVDAGRQIGGYPIRQYKPPPGGSAEQRHWREQEISLIAGGIGL